MPYRDPVGAHRNVGIPVMARAWTDQRIEGEDVAGVIYQDCAFERVHFVNMNFEKSLFVNTRFDDCVLEGCRINETLWSECSGDGLRISAGVLVAGVFAQCEFGYLDIEQSGERVAISGSRFDRVAFREMGCRQHNLLISDCAVDGPVVADRAEWEVGCAIDVDLKKWSMDDGVFTRCSFIRANGRDGDFAKVRFDSCNLYQSDFRGATLRSAGGSIFSECDLTEADLADAALAGALFAKVTAPRANFQGATLDNAMFPGATLAGAVFHGASAVQSVWTEADLAGADLEGVDAFRSTFRNAKFKDTNVLNARLVETELHGVEQDLSEADLRGSRGTIEWRAEREAEMRKPPE